MLKNILNLGTVISSIEQQSIIGGRFFTTPGDRCSIVFMCPVGEICRYTDNDGNIGTCEYA